VKIKVFSAMTEKGLEKKVNAFIAQESIKVLELQHSAGYGCASVMVVYDEKFGTAQ